MNEVHGNTEGIKKTLLDELAALYGLELSEDEFFTVEAAEALADYSHRINREIAVYLSRGGDVLDVVIGENDRVDLPDFRMRRGETGLSRVRVVHTHPGGSAALSRVDVTALTALRLDAMCALGVDDEGKVNGISCAFISGRDPGGTIIFEETPIYPLRNLPRLNWMYRIEEAEQALPPALIENSQSSERAVLISIRDDASFDELEDLASTAGAVTVARVLQKRPRPDSATYLGIGKAKDLALLTQTAHADLIIAEDELSGVQLHNLESITGVRVVDRTALILDIFAQRARTREGQLQVSLAQLDYQMSHLIGFGLSLSRLGGGIGTRGPGETRLEMDRRLIRRRHVQLTQQLEGLNRQRSLQRKNRRKNEIPTVALVGYTNAGKSTLFNRLTDSDVYVMDQLFATLDATTRKVVCPDGGSFLLSDTVGFISHLPTELIDAFHSTLEEAVLADLLIVLTDASDTHAVEKRQVVQETLVRLGADRNSIIEVLNKCDKADAGILAAFPDAIRVCALDGSGTDELKSAILHALEPDTVEFSVKIPYESMKHSDMIRKAACLRSEEYLDDGLKLTGSMDKADFDRIIKTTGLILQPVDKV